MSNYSPFGSLEFFQAAEFLFAAYSLDEANRDRAAVSIPLPVKDVGFKKPSTSTRHRRAKSQRGNAALFGRT